MAELIELNEYFSPQQIINEIAHIRQLFYCNEMPSTRINTSLPNYGNYKCRKAYFASINCIIDFINLNQDNNLREKCEDYRKFVTTTISNRGDTPETWITASDIHTADSFLNYLEEYFKSKT
jgi:hypothetical protein